MDKREIIIQLINKNNTQNGITLVALVITIIVLLILAGVAISSLSGESSIIQNAEDTVGVYDNKVEKHDYKVNKLEEKMYEYFKGDIIPPDDSNVDENGLSKENVIIKPKENSNLQIVIPTGYAPAVLAESNSTNSLSSLPGKNGNVVGILPEDKWQSITEEEINKGIVIVDHAITYDNGQMTGEVPDFNEYVWIPIPDSEDFDRIAWTTRYGYNSEGEYVDGGDEGIAQLLVEVSAEDKNNAYWENTTSSEYTSMVSSINTNKGFYIGRYEASRDSTGTIAQSKRGQSAWVNVTQADAITKCSNNNMHLIYGIEWDSVLNWLKNNAIIPSLTAGQTKTMEISDIQTNSNTWGNYKYSTGDATTPPYVQGELQTTGASEYWKSNNIYDLAGNVSEWIQEKYSTEGEIGYRGGLYYSDGAKQPVGVRAKYGADTEVMSVRFPC